MRTRYLILTACLITFLTGITATWLLSRHPVDIPDRWRENNLNVLSFYAPPDMRGRVANGADSAGWEYQNSDIHLSIEYSMHANPLDIYEGQSEFQEEWAKIDGKDVRLCTFKVDNTNSATRGAGDKNFVIAAHFNNVGVLSENRVTVLINCTSVTAREEARRILSTIQFNK